MKRLIILAIGIWGVITGINAQETLPVYTDYLSDNVYLIHPAAAGIGNCGKIRLTGRMQWLNNDDSPQLQTFSAHTRIGDNMGLGMVAFNDKNGYHSQVGGQLTYAYHIIFDPYDTNQLSFGISAMGVRNTLDERAFLLSDPVITQQINSRFYFNMDAGIAYHYAGFWSYLTAKNIVLSARNLYNDRFESLNLRRYLASIGYFISGSESIQFEPSVMVQYIERTQEKFLDANLVSYIPFDNGQIWLGLSYRRGFDFGDYEAPNYFTPLLGINFQNFVLSYTYTHQQNDILFDDGGFHQLTLGFNFLCKEKFSRLGACPNLSSGF
jgi:type IX secretion system PorP/SprF family membrane protein